MRIVWVDLLARSMMAKRIESEAAHLALTDVQGREVRLVSRGALGRA
jgi:hypothetical protein